MAKECTIPMNHLDYKNKKQISQGIDAFKASLFISPSEKTYFELGSALADNKNYEEALKAKN